MKGTTRRKFIKLGIAALTALVSIDAFWIEKFFIETNEFFLGDSTATTTNIKIIQVSDLHLQAVGRALTQLAQTINNAKPDLILFTGDAIDKAANISVLNDFLKLIDGHIRKIAILGNWEYWGKVDLQELRRTYNRHNGILLINQTIQYSFHEKTISITGVDDYVGGYADIEVAVSGYKKSDFHVILNHCPEYRDHIAKQLSDEINVDFVLSGHTHGGQVNLFGFAPFLPPGSGRYVKGWYNEGHPKLYVSKGIGTSIFPARFGARAEIAIFNFKA